MFNLTLQICNDYNLIIKIPIMSNNIDYNSQRSGHNNFKKKLYESFANLNKRNNNIWKEKLNV